MRSFKGSPSGPLVCQAVTVSYDPPSLATLVGTYAAVTVAGAKTRQRVLVNPLADVSAPGYIIGANAYVSADNTVRMMNCNITAGTLNPDALNVSFILFGDASQD